MLSPAKAPSAPARITQPSDRSPTTQRSPATITIDSLGNAGKTPSPSAIANTIRYASGGWESRSKADWNTPGMIAARAILGAGQAQRSHVVGSDPGNTSELAMSRDSPRTRLNSPCPGDSPRTGLFGPRPERAVAGDLAEADRLVEAARDRVGIVASAADHGFRRALVPQAPQREQVDRSREALAQ